MKCFELVQRVLEDTYASIPGDEDQRTQLVEEALAALSTRYHGELDVVGGLDFDNPVTRFAYVCCYLPAHAHWIYELVQWSRAAQACLARSKVRIACIGGGPGSDLLGILKYLGYRGSSPPALFCEIVDGSLEWKQTWSDLAFLMKWPPRLNTDFVVHPIGSGREWRQPDRFDRADLVTINFFFSEIAHLEDTTDAYITRLFRRLKPGAIVLFNDNDDPRCYTRFDALALRVGMETLSSNSGTRKAYDLPEQVNELGAFRTRFANYNPRLTGQVAWRVLRKG